jgi:hypothetical protein
MEFDMSKTGMAFCLIYMLIIILCCSLALWADGDPKGQFVLLQLPLALQLGILHKIGLDTLLPNSWFVGYLVIVPPTFAPLYCFGWFIEYMKARKQETLLVFIILIVYIALTGWLG